MLQLSRPFLVDAYWFALEHLAYFDNLKPHCLIFEAEKLELGLPT